MDKTIRALRYLFLWVFFINNKIFAFSETSKILIPNENPKSISIKQALDMALITNYNIKIAKNHVEQKKAQQIYKLSNHLPKVKLEGHYVRNIPESKIDLSAMMPDETSLYQKMAESFENQGEQETANELRSSLDKMQRRSSSGNIVTMPKTALEGKIILEIPLFNGPHFLKTFNAFNQISLLEARFKEEEAKVIYEVSKIYLEGFYLSEILNLTNIQLKKAKEKHLKFLNSNKKRGLINKYEQLIEESNYLDLEAKAKLIEIDFNTTLALLGLKIDMKENFLLTNPGLKLDALMNNDEELLNLALKNRPDIVAQKKAVDIMNKESASGFLEFLPSLNLRGNANYTSNTKGFIKEHWTYAVSLNLNWSLFEGGKSIGLLKERVLKKAEEELKLRQMVMEVETKVRGAKAKLDQLSLELKSKELLEKALKERVKVSKNAEEQYLNAQIALQKVKNDIIKEQLALAYETGLLTPQYIEDISNVSNKQP